MTANLTDYHRAADGWAELDVDHWTAELRAAGWVGNLRRRPRGPIVVYRGQSDVRSQLSLSWTRSRHNALHFARRHVTIAATIDRAAVTATVWRAVAPPAAVLGVGDDTIGEHGEILTDPACLLDVRPVLQVTGDAWPYRVRRITAQFAQNDMSR